MSVKKSASSGTVPGRLEHLRRSPEEIEEIVEIFRLELYNRGQPCGAEAISERLGEEGVVPLPSARMIGRILSRRCLTHGRTGYYPEDFVWWDGS